MLDPNRPILDRKTVFRTVCALVCALVGASSAGCSSSNSGNPATGGNTNGSGGSASAAGGSSANGGATAQGGASATGGASSGGSNAAGGATSLGGASGSGGSSNGGSAGSASGGATAAGGSGAGGKAQGGSAGSANGGSAGSANGGSAGAAGSAAAPLFSDDFEASALNSKWIPKLNGSGTFTLDKAQKHGGSQSLHATTNSGYSTLLAIEDSSIFPAPNNTFFGRVWLRVPTLPASAHVIWMEAGDTTNDTHEVRIGMNLGYLQTNLYFNGEVDLRDPAASLMAATWQCIEFKMGNDELVVWLNGTQSTAVSTTNWAQVGNGSNGGGAARSNWSPTYKSFRLGWELNAGPDIWFDDVALSHSRIGCQ